MVRSPNWIGDCVMALPAIRALKFYFPQSHIYLVTKHYLSAVFENIPEIKEIVTIPDETNIKTILATSRLLRKYHLQQGILFTNSFSSALLFRLAGINKLTGYVKDSRGILLSTCFPFPKDQKHHVHFYMNLIRGFKENHKKLVKQVEQSPVALADFLQSNAPVITTAERIKVFSRLAELGVAKDRVLVGISPAAAYGSAKQWLPERWQQLVYLIGKELPDIQLLLLGSAKEREQITEITGRDGSSEIINLAGQLSLRETLVTISLCQTFIANDSGLMHVAASFDLPLIALFGPTRQEKTAPQNPKAMVIHYPPHCAPCSHRVCPYPDHPCMSAITVAEVFEKLVACLSADRAVSLP